MVELGGTVAPDGNESATQEQGTIRLSIADTPLKEASPTSGLEVPL